MTESPWEILHLDLAGGVAEVARRDHGLFLVLWWGALPLGAKALLPAETPLGRDQLLALASPWVADQAWARARGPGAAPRAGFDGQPHHDLSLGDAARLPVLERLAQAAGRSGQGADRLAVIVCTRGRPGMLEACLASLAAQDAPPVQVVVVDNDPAASARAVAADRPGVTYVHEPRPGLSIARNAGLAAAHAEFVAFTDDDVELHPAWTGELVRAFDTSGADAVTGLVLPASLATPAQRAFELHLGGFTSRFTPLLFDPGFLEETREAGPQVWRIGAGANMAFRRASLAGLGGFDERLGAGAAGCSEDSEFWYRILAAGGRCLYEPRAVVFHHHRRDWRGLRRQYRAYMQGHVAALVAQADRYGAPGDLRRIRRQLPVYFARTALGAIQTLDGWRLRLLAAEVIGWTAGLQYLFRPGWRRRPGVAPGSRPVADIGAAQHA
ncbi:glycosyltransferase family 2 protein [Phenylobacterium sp.]|uniref:glycosyltransferase family 2 protein n=1 Tax=Phenylobacterium sp. TaxID=1871053 RepID=UPI002C9A2691|nr:glycosyltransferase [Phenylobacterium sp.]HVI30653.1 glycosyltransferase [Phenylobacterium sp.]